MGNLSKELKTEVDAFKEQIISKNEKQEQEFEEEKDININNTNTEELKKNSDIAINENEEIYKKSLNIEGVLVQEDSNLLLMKDQDINFYTKGVPIK